MTPLTPALPAGDAARSSARGRWQPRLPTLLGGLVLALLCALRCPALLSAPRFWAEEGALFFVDAHVHGFWANLLRPQLGYLNVSASLSTSLASLLPLEWGPSFTTAFAFAVQWSVAMLAFTMSSRAVPAAWQRLLLAGFVLALAPSEIWLTSTNLHYWLGVAAILLWYDERVDHGRRQLVHRLLLVLAAGSGVQACFLTPLYAWRAATTRSRERWLQTAILAVGATLQLGVLVWSASAGDAALGTRFDTPAFELAVVAGHHFTIPVVGQEYWSWPMSWLLALASWLGPWFGADPAASAGLPAVGWVVNGCTIAIAVAVLAVAVRQCRQPRDRQAWVAWLVLVVLSTLGSLHMAGGYRYAFGPNVVLVVQLLAGRQAGPAWQRRVGAALLVVAAVTNTRHFGSRVHWSAQLPQWTEEVRRWRTDPSHALAIWPEGWSLRLPR